MLHRPAVLHRLDTTDVRHLSAVLLCLQASQTSCITDPAVTGTPPAFDLDLCTSL